MMFDNLWEISKCISSSDKFRYPTNKHLDLHFRDKKKFQIDNVNQFFGDLTSFLSAVNTMMSIHNEIKG